MRSAWVAAVVLAATVVLTPSAPAAPIVEPRDGDLVLYAGQPSQRGWRQSRHAGDGGPATHAELGKPTWLALDGQGNVFFSDSVSPSYRLGDPEHADNTRVRRVDQSTRTITTVAGTGVLGSTGDGGPATEASISVHSLAVTPAADLVIAERRGGCRIRRVDQASGTITTVAGTGTCSSTGDGGSALQATVDPRAIALGPQGDLYLAGGSRIRRIDGQTGVIETVAHGVGTLRAMVVADDGAIYVSQPGAHEVRRVDPDGAMTVVASEDDVFHPRGLALDADGDLYIAMFDAVRRLDRSTGSITTVASGRTGYLDPSEQPLPATAIWLYEPAGLAFGAGDELFVADDRSNFVVRITRPERGAVPGF